MKALRSAANPAAVSARSTGARRAMWFIIGLHGALLLCMLPDYFPDNDLGYHVSLARQYAEHGVYFWDHLNYAPAGRPNLQGPLLHVANGLLGRLLGGTGDDYILAFSLLAVLQWVAAVFTAVFFARRFGGDRAALVAAALLTGSVYSAAPFFAGVPSGWIFILTPWAIHFFLQDRWLLASLFTTAVVYVHLGGITTAPFGIFLAALLTRRWRALLATGAVTAVLASPYVIHFVRHLDWYRGQRGHVAGSAAYLIYLLAVPGLLALLRRPRQNVFLIAWAAAPLAWVFQDALRFILQSTVAGAAIGSVFFVRLLDRYVAPSRRTAFIAALIVLATIFPLSIPSLPLEVAWAAGHRFPRELDWTEARQIAAVIDRDRLNGMIVSSYYGSLGCALSVFTPVAQEKGHWHEVQPKVDPIWQVSAGKKVYLLAMPPSDETLRDFEARGLIRLHGGSAQTSVVTLTTPGDLSLVAPLTVEVINREALWLSEHAENNTLGPVLRAFSPTALAARRKRMARQRAHAGRMHLAVVVYSYALEPAHPETAMAVRRGTRGFGSLANFLGDETAIDYISDAKFAVFRRNLVNFANEVTVLRNQPLPSPQLDEASSKMFREYF